MSQTTVPSDTIAWRNLRTGLLFLVGLLLTGSLALIIGKNTGIGTSHKSLHIFVTDVQGLTEANMVSISGKKVGTISKIELVRRDGKPGARIDLDVRSEYFHLIDRDTRAVIKGIGILGDTYIDLALGNSRETIAEGSYLVVETSPGLTEVTNTALKTMQTVDTLTTQLAILTRKINGGEGTLGRLVNSTELNDRLVGTVETFDRLATRMSSGNGLVPRLLNDPELAGRVNSMMANMNDATNALQQMTTSLQSGKGSLGKLMVDETFYQNLTRIAGRADSLLAMFSDPNNGLGRFSRDTKLYDNINHSISSLDSLLNDLKSNPERYVKLSLF